MIFACTVAAHPQLSTPAVQNHALLYSNCEPFATLGYQFPPWATPCVRARPLPLYVVNHSSAFDCLCFMPCHGFACPVRWRIELLKLAYMSASDNRSRLQAVGVGDCWSAGGVTFNGDAQGACTPNRQQPYPA